MMVFKDVTIDPGLPENLNGLGGFVGDINGDTWPDIFFAQTSVMYINNRNGTFRKLPFDFFDHAYTGNARSGNENWTCGAELGDLNGDGLLDMVMGDHFQNTKTFEHRIRVFINRGINPEGDPRFEEVGDKAGIKTVDQKEPHVAIEDFDNDGDMDILVATRENFIYTNTGAGPDGIPFFTGPTGSNAPEGGLDYWPAGPTADYDRDGRLDFFGAQWYAYITSPLLRNVTEGDADYISIGINIPSEKNRNGIGATVRIYKPGQSGKKDALLGIKCISVANGYSSGTTAEAHFGTPGYSKVDIEVKMPCNGRTYISKGVTTRQLFTFNESAAQVAGEGKRK